MRFRFKISRRMGFRDTPAFNAAGKVMRPVLPESLG